MGSPYVTLRYPALRINPRLALRTGLSAAFLTALPLTPAPSAHAADGTGSDADAGTVTVSPSAPAPGGDIALRVTGCRAASATAVSSAFASAARLSGSDGTLTGRTRIRTAAEAGAHAVRITCGGRTTDGSVRVTDPGAQERPAPASPTAPGHAGGGGSAAHLATGAKPDRDGGPGAAHAITGLLLAGAAAVAVILRGARKSRRTP
ncbi:hypothetical protein ABZX40_37600 [Streptomyces sp. NPDC004610]|uniref:hypothetical protein n=1 Tax=unclassified Streptomyces TaxID=2593676 RepID=UPI0033BF09C6